MKRVHVGIEARRGRWMTAVLASLLVLVSCAGSSSSGPVGPPTGLTYGAGGTVWLDEGEAMAPLAPTYLGSAEGFLISAGSLPTGLKFNETTGQVTGVPEEPSGPTAITVAAAYQGQLADFTSVTIGVQERRTEAFLSVEDATSSITLLELRGEGRWPVPVDVRGGLGSLTTSSVDWRGQYAVVGNGDRQVYGIRFERTESGPSLSVTGPVGFVGTGSSDYPWESSIDPSGKYAYVLGASNQVLDSYSISMSGSLTKGPSLHAPTGAGFSHVVASAPGGASLLAMFGQQGGTTQVWSYERVGSGFVLRDTAPIAAPVSMVASTPSGRWVFAVVPSLKTVYGFRIGPDGQVTQASAAGYEFSGQPEKVVSGIAVSSHVVALSFQSGGVATAPISGGFTGGFNSESHSKFVGFGAVVLDSLGSRLHAVESNGRTRWSFAVNASGVPSELVKDSRSRHFARSNALHPVRTVDLGAWTPLVGLGLATSGNLLYQFDLAAADVEMMPKPTVPVASSHQAMIVGPPGSTVHFLDQGVGSPGLHSYKWGLAGIGGKQGVLSWTDPVGDLSVSEASRTWSWMDELTDSPAKGEFAFNGLPAGAPVGSTLSFAGEATVSSGSGILDVVVGGTAGEAALMIYHPTYKTYLEASSLAGTLGGHILGHRIHPSGVGFVAAVNMGPGQVVLKTISIKEDYSLALDAGQITLPGAYARMEFSPDGRHLVVATTAFNKLYSLPVTVDADSEELELSVQGGAYQASLSGYPNTLAISKGGEFVFVSIDSPSSLLRFGYSGTFGSVSASPTLIHEVDSFVLFETWTVGD